MKTYRVRLESPVATSFRCTRAANALDIDQKKKSVHALDVQADLDPPFNVGLIVGASGSGKTTLAEEMFGEGCFRTLLDELLPIIDQFPASMSYDECAATLNGVGLTQVPCWIRPAYTLSNGQRVRAECALQIANTNTDDIIAIDEWTSVVDRTVAKVMSYCIAKHARRTNARIVLCSCHYDVVEWLNPDWIIDCNSGEYVERRHLQRDFKRTETLDFAIAECDRSTWRGFSRYHYLSDRLPGGFIKTYGLFHDGDQVGFQCFANYVPHRAGTQMVVHSNRTVIHPDYAGFGLGIKVINETSAIMAQEGFDVRAKFSSLPVYKAMNRQPCWIHQETKRAHKVVLGGNMARDAGFRVDVTTYAFAFSLGKFKEMKGCL